MAQVSLVNVNVDAALAADLDGLRMPNSNKMMKEIESAVDSIIANLKNRAEEIKFTNLLDCTKEIWKDSGYQVYVDTDRKRITIVKINTK